MVPAGSTFVSWVLEQRRRHRPATKNADHDVGKTVGCKERRRDIGRRGCRGNALTILGHDRKARGGEGRKGEAAKNRGIGVAKERKKNKL